MISQVMELHPNIRHIHLGGDEVRNTKLIRRTLMPAEKTLE